MKFKMDWGAGGDYGQGTCLSPARALPLVATLKHVCGECLSCDTSQRWLCPPLPSTPQTRPCQLRQGMCALSICLDIRAAMAAQDMSSHSHQLLLAVCKCWAFSCESEQTFHGFHSCSCSSLGCNSRSAEDLLVSHAVPAAPEGNPLLHCRMAAPNHKCQWEDRGFQ